MDATPTETHSFPSGFYLLVEDAVDAVLEFPVDDDSGGPFWNDDGQLDLVRCKEWDLIRPEFHRHSVAALRVAPFKLHR